MNVTGGQATSIPLDKDKCGTDWLNDGVQGGFPVSHLLLVNTYCSLTKTRCRFSSIRLDTFGKYGHEPHEVKLQVSFGKGKDGFWTNCFPSILVEEFSGDIKKFGKVLKFIRWTIPVLGVAPVKTMLKMFFFSKDFGDKMVFPL